MSNIRTYFTLSCLCINKGIVSIISTDNNINNVKYIIFNKNHQFFIRFIFYIYSLTINNTLSLIYSFYNDFDELLRYE